MTIYFGTVTAAGVSNFGGSDDSTGWFWRANVGVSHVCPGVGEQRVEEMSSEVGIFSGAPNILIALYDAAGALVGQGSAAVAVTNPKAWQGHMTRAAIKPARGVAGDPMVLIGGQSYRFAVARDAAGILATDTSGNILTLGDVDYNSAQDLTGGWPAVLPSGTDYDGYLTSVRIGVSPVPTRRIITEGNLGILLEDGKSLFTG